LPQVFRIYRYFPLKSPAEFLAAYFGAIPMSQHPVKIYRFSSGILGLLCLSFVLLPSDANANPAAPAPCPTNMSHGSGYNMSHGSGGHKGGGKGSREYANKAGEIKQLLGSHQRAHSLASQRLSEIKLSGNYAQLGAAQAAEANAAQVLAQTQAQAREFLSSPSGSAAGSPSSPTW
jgi:hypothetical protein